MIRKTFLPLVLLTVFFLVANGQVPGSAIDVQHYNFSIRLNDQNDTIKGKADIDVRFLKDADSFTIDLVKPNDKGKGMLVSSVTENSADVPFQQGDDAVNISASGKAGSEHTYTINYAGIPADGLIISTNKFGHRTFFGDNWPNRAHNWLPCVDNIADKATVDFDVVAPKHYDVVANGAKAGEKILPGDLKETHWQESAPLSTKVMVIGVADFAIDHTGDVKGIPVYTYVFPENKELGFNSYAVAKEILAYYIGKIGPFAYEKLANVQSKTIFGGMENASCIFYFENSVGDKGIEELMAHEIAHQWFGDAASEKSFGHLWLSEGFATFMTNVYLENKYGEDILKQRLKDDRKTVFEFEKQHFAPVVDTTVKDNFMQLLNPNSYQKGGWVLHMLNQKLGDKAFWTGIRNYYAKYKNGNAGTKDLRHMLEQASGQDLEPFFKQWLYTTGTPDLEISWKYDANKKAVGLDVTQKQQTAFEFPLELSVGGKVHTLSIKNKTTHFEIAVSEQPSAVIADPNVNLLARFDVKAVD
ncbi:MAG: M1 family metallopeptidase [Bacteroidetes bacterium]|nr:M1 family metallopeptidase [Bacteroidota bacterium]